ncbi:MAG: heparinase II/III family protein, partial [Planctomycetota bacterium]|nr:heparinase II/III family protein [Planctomycetota bacterium]
MLRMITQVHAGRCFACCSSLALLAGTLLYTARAEEPKAAPPKRTNAALEAMGASVRFTAPKEVSRNKETAPEASFDGDVHSRCVVSGVPYTFEVELVEALPVDAIAFADSDYESEEAPKDVIIELDDGTKIEHALEIQRPAKRKPAWQEVAIGKTARTIKITVTSNHAGKVAWGGIGDIAVFTKEDLSQKLALPNYDANAPAYVDVPPLEAANGEIKVRMPPKAAKDDHPCLLLTPKELEEAREAGKTKERAKEAYALLESKAEDALKLEIDFPDPKGPGAQLKDRGDELAKRHDKLSYSAGNLGMAYAFLGKEAYAKKAREILIGYAERYEQYPEHQGVNRSDTSKVMAQRLSEAMWLVPLLIGYDYIHPSLSAEDRAKIETGLIRPCLKMIHRKDPKSIAAEWDKSRAGWRAGGPPKPKTTHVVGNWTNFYNLATIMAGATLGDADLVDLAVYQTKENLLAGIGEDGMWGEGTIGYQMFALQALTAVMEVAARQGVDLWGFDGARIKMPFDANFRFAYPDGSAPGINDSGRVTFSDWSGMVYDYAYLRYVDPRYARLVNACPRQFVISTGVYYPTRVYDKLEEPAEIAYPSTVFKDLGYAILRSGGTYALMDYGPHGGPHGHPDKLNLILFAAGDELGGEPKMHRYEDPLHGAWTKATVAHNTMAVDERSQSACAGKLLVYAD